MTLLKHAMAGFNVMACAGTSLAQTSTPMSATDEKMMGSCMGMASDAMMKDTGCMDVMKRMNMSSGDMTMMKSCMAMAKDAMTKDTSCSAMMKAHPAMMGMGTAK